MSGKSLPDHKRLLLTIVALVLASVQFFAAPPCAFAQRTAHWRKLLDAGRAASDLGNFDNALILFNDAAAECTYNGTNLDLGYCLSWLASSFYGAKDWPEARATYQRCLGVYEKAAGPNSPQVADTAISFGNFLLSRNSVAEAETCFRRALTIKQSTHADDQQILDCKLQLAEIDVAQGKQAEAETLLKECLAAKKAKLGELHPDVAALMIRLARLYMSQARYVEAEPVLIHAQAIYTQAAKQQPSEQSISCQLEIAQLYVAQQRYSKAEPLYERSLSDSETISGSDSISVTPALDGLAFLRQVQGQYKDAEALSRRSLALKQSAFGAESSKTADAVINLANVLKQEHHGSEAEDLFNRSIKIFEQTSARDGRPLANSLTYLADFLQDGRRYDEAEGLYKRALSLQEKELDPKDETLAGPINNLADLYKAEGHYTDAAQLFKRSQSLSPSAMSDPFSREAQAKRLRLTTTASAIIQRYVAQNHGPSDPAAQDSWFKSQFGGDSVEYSTYLELVSLQALETDPLADVMPSFEKILTIRTKVLGQNDVWTADSLLQIAISLKALSADVKDQAITAFLPLQTFAHQLINANSTDKACANSVALLGDRDAALSFASNALSCVGNLLADCSEEQKAKDAFDLSEQCLIARKNISPRSQVDDLLDIATSRQLLMDYAKAAGSIEQAERVAGQDASLKYKCEIALSKLALGQADLSQALSYANQALEIGRSLYKESGLELFDCYEILSECSAATKDPNQAVNYAKSALALSGISDEQRRSSLVLLANYLLALGDNVTAESTYWQALNLAQGNDSSSPSKRLSQDQSIRAAAARGLGYLNEYRDNHEGARQLFDWAIYRDRGNPTPDGLLALAQDYNGLALVEHGEGHGDVAQKNVIAASELIDKYITNVFPQLPFEQQCAFIAVAQEQRDALLSICNNSDSIGPAYTLMIKWKGLLVESLRRQGAVTAALTRDPLLAQKHSELIQATRELAGLTNKRSDLRKDSDTNLRINQLAEKEERLERELMEQADVNVADPVRGLAVDDFRNSLHADEAFVDVVSYKPLHQDSEVYAAIVMKAGISGGPKFFSLGKSEDLVDRVHNWRFATTLDHGELQRGGQVERNIVLATVTPEEALSKDDYQRATDAIAELIVNNKNIQQFLGRGIKKIWVCPEGELARIPWNAIGMISAVTAANLFCEVDSPREFICLRSSKTPPTRAKSVMLAGISKFAESDLPELPGARREIDSLKAKADEFRLTSDYLVDERATKESVSAKLEQAGIAHIATHGFARGDNTGGAGGRGAASAHVLIRAADATQVVSSARNPLVDCGLYFAFPKSWSGDADEAPNILTASEIVGLNLSRCDLITLSACQTALGHGMNGQGIVGLRSAILGAGARSILMSLWSVDDDATRQLMDSFYGYLWDRSKTLTKVEALRKAQDDIRSQERWHDPKFWAGWVLAGEGWR